MSGGHEVDAGSPEKRKTLWVVLWLNVAIAIGFFAVGYFADSNALLANGLDNSSDAIVYALSLLALTRSRTWKRGPRVSPASCCWSSPLGSFSMLTDGSWKVPIRAAC